ncbi:hypothetical protein [Longispora albida]|uniref:hypothetical protein n=1 Tax=Longispora albida TaxID=203523 RepID=UPI001B7FD5B6|nr:hypothetical protein [Longispora albida]
MNIDDRDNAGRRTTGGGDVDGVGSDGMEAGATGMGGREAGGTGAGRTDANAEPGVDAYAYDMAGVIDPVARLRVLAAGIPGARVLEHRIEVSFPQVWRVMSDLEGDFGRFQPDMTGVTVLGRDGDRVTALARSRWGFRARLEGVVRPGWCWLQSRFLIIGMAAVPAGDGATRVALTGGVRVPGRAMIVPVGARRELRRALTKLDQLV